MSTLSRLDPVFVMLCGLPGSGKTTIRKRIDHAWDFPGCQVVATDDWIELAAQKERKTYSDVFTSAIEWATVEAQKQLERAFTFGWSVMQDQTNLTVKRRRAKMESVPKGYRKVCLFVTCDEDVRQLRLANRLGKIIPEGVDKVMRESWEPPSLAEGWDVVAPSYLWAPVLFPYLSP